MSPRAENRSRDARPLRSVESLVAQAKLLHRAPTVQQAPGRSFRGANAEGKDADAKRRKARKAEKVARRRQRGRN